MSLELSDEMYQRLIELMTDAQVAAGNAQREVALLRQERDRDYSELKGAFAMLQAGFGAVEEDLSEVQKALRGQSTALESQAVGLDLMAQKIGGLAQAVDGITQLTMSNFDQLESLRKQAYGEESDRIEHGEAGGNAQ